MKIQLVACLALAVLIGGSTGCQENQTVETQKPMIESEAAQDAADAVTPDEPIVDIETPLGDVEVGKDPATGGTNVDVDTKRADVDVDAGE